MEIGSRSHEIAERTGSFWRPPGPATNQPVPTWGPLVTDGAGSSGDPCPSRGRPTTCARITFIPKGHILEDGVLVYELPTPPHVRLPSHAELRYLLDAVAALHRIELGAVLATISRHAILPSARSGGVWTVATQQRERRRDWRRAWRSVRTLHAHPEQTEAVFEILDALAGPTDEASFREFAAHPDGQRLLAAKPSLLDTLSDHQALRKLREGSFGRAYLRFMEEANLNARDLVEAEAESGAPVDEDPDRQWLADRGRDSHDLWHVLTGYGRDEAGEVSLLAFTYANYPNPGIALILLVAAVAGPKSLSFWWQRYIWQAYRRGRAAHLDFAPYEAWLALPLDEVRAAANIIAPERAHPGYGILAANRGDPGFAAA